MDEIKRLHVDMAIWREGIHPDDFLIAIGIKKSNSVYHVVESHPKATKNERIIRYHVKVLKSDLLTALKRDPIQQLIPIYWHRRKKKK